MLDFYRTSIVRNAMKDMEESDADGSNHFQKKRPEKNPVFQKYTIDI